MDDFIKSLSSVQDFGIAGLVLLFAYWTMRYFGDDIRSFIASYPARKKRHEQLIENNTAALNLCTAALENNTAVIQRFERDNNKLESIIREHDSTSSLRFESQKEALGRIEGKLK